MTEAELLAEVLHIARRYNVLAFHSGDPRRDTGAGFPDLVLCGVNGTLFAELKSELGGTEPEQTTWKYRLMASGMPYCLWRPADFRDGTIRRKIMALQYERDPGNRGDGEPVHPFTD